ncbi:hypothetical protein [Prevotella pallens]
MYINGHSTGSIHCVNVQQRTHRRRRGRFISPDNHFIIQQTHHKVYSLHNISKHTVGVGADLSRPTIIHNPANTPQGLFIA